MSLRGVLLAACLAAAVTAASQAQGWELQGRTLAAAKPLAADEVQGVDVQVVLTPTNWDKVGSRFMRQVADDIRLEVSAGSQRKEGLKHFLAASGLDPGANLPLPAVFTGAETRRATTTLPPTTPFGMVEEVTTRTTTSTPWPNIPANPLLPLNQAAMTTTTMVSMRLMIGTKLTTTAQLISTTGREGWMAIPASAYSVKAPQVFPLKKKIGPDGEEMECTGSLCRSAKGDSGVVLHPM